MDREKALELYQKMCLIRCFEETVSELRFAGKLYGAVHCCIGQEAVSAGVCSALEQDDYIIGTHRSHGFMLSKGADVNKMMAELYGRRSGTNGGRGGSLHVCDPDVNALGATGIVGSGIPIACGAAFASKYKKENRVSIVFLGDGAANEGVFYESLNLASVWNLPVVFVVENNGLAVTTQNSTTTANVDIFEHASSFGIKGQVVDGQNVETVYHTTKAVLERVRVECRPEILEFKTYRFHEHAEGKGYYRMHDVGYRDTAKVEDAIINKDPIKIFEESLAISYGIGKDELEIIKGNQKKEVASARIFAEEDLLPDPATASKYVFL